jgi:serine/threonine-protein kinase
LARAEPLTRRIWGWVRGKLRPSAQASPARQAAGDAETTAATDDPALVAVAKLDPASEESIREALHALRAARGTPEERAVLDRVLSLHAERRAPPALSVAASELLVQRGQSEQALALLDGLSDARALMLSSDLRAERGELGHALTLVERVLARDLDHPGARERHERYRRALGGPTAASEPGADQPTLLRAELPATNLRIVAETSRGGAGTVYEAVDDLLGRKVALKVYHRPNEERDKLEREGRVAVSLAGRGVIRVFDIDPARGLLVMEWIALGSLRGFIQRADPTLLLPIERWFTPLVEAVARVHGAGIVHADLKPGNVLFRSVSEPVISDFGIARPPGEPALGGSFGYVSPERWQGCALDYGDDLYALGRVLEQALYALERAPAETPGRRPASDFGAWFELVGRLTGQLSERPATALALLDLLGR